MAEQAGVESEADRRARLLREETDRALKGDRFKKKEKPGGSFKDKEGYTLPHAPDPDAGNAKNGDFPKGAVGVGRIKMPGR